MVPSLTSSMASASGADWVTLPATMTLNGTVNKTGILLVCAIVTAGWTWFQFMQSRDAGDVMPWMFGGLIGGFIFAMVTIFKKEWAPVTAPAYALLEGPGFSEESSALFELRYPGIAIQAVGLSFGTHLPPCCFSTAPASSRSRTSFVWESLQPPTISRSFICLEMVLGLFGVNFAGPSGVNGSGVIGIGFSLIVVGVAALNLVLDFDFIEKGVQYGAPKYMEWYGAFGIMVTLVWLYLEILNLLAKMNRRN